MKISARLVRPDRFRAGRRRPHAIAR